MKRVFITLRNLITVLLIIQIGSAYALPAGGSFNLCIGIDGHFDIEMVGLAGLPSQPMHQLNTIASEEGHHGDCVDVAIDWNSPASRLTVYEQLRSFKKDGALSALYEISRPTHTTRFIDRSVIPISHILSHRSVVLLI